MTIWERLYGIVAHSLPTLAVIFALVLVLLALQAFYKKRYSDIPGYRFRLHLILSLIILTGIILIIVVLPVTDTLRAQLLGLIGILLSATIALSAATFMGNAMAGIMLRSIRSFKLGDFIRTENHFGKVSEMGLFHIEIQTQDSNLTTFSNLFLVSNPYHVIRSSGTIVSADISLGYDIHHTTIAPLLKDAADAVGLLEPFVSITQLGDFAVTYKINGLLQDTKNLISIQSKLHEKMLDSLHQANVEIVSPHFKNTRTLPADKFFIPKQPHSVEETPNQGEVTPESIVFEKADSAENIESLRQTLEDTDQKITATQEQIGKAESDEQLGMLNKKLTNLKQQKENLEKLFRQKEAEQENQD